MTQTIEFEMDENGGFHLLLDGEDKGVVDTESLREESEKLHMHFRMFNREVPEDTAENPAQLNDPTDEELEDELEEIKEILEDIEAETEQRK